MKQLYHLASKAQVSDKVKIKSPKKLRIDIVKSRNKIPQPSLLHLILGKQEINLI